MMMRKTLFCAVSAAMLLAGCSAETTAPPAAESATAAVAASAAAQAADAAASVTAAMSALGMDGMNTITYSGTAWRVRNSFRQTLSASPPWPNRDNITGYRRTLDLTDAANPVSLARGDVTAQDLFFNPPVAAAYTQNIPATQKTWGQQLEIWLTPWGFLKGAQQNGATEIPSTVAGSVKAISWNSPASQTSPGGLQYTVTGYLNADNFLTRIETKMEDGFMGDLEVVALYSDYRQLNGKMVPRTMEQRRGGGGVFGVKLVDVAMNPANAAELLTPPAPPTPPGGGAPAGGAPAAPAELSVQVGDGVYWIKTGYTSLAVDFTDFVAVFEAGGTNDAIGEQILAEVKRLFPGKEIRYVINSHPHSDHTGGLVPFVREGATIITHANNVDFLNMALSTPRTLLGQPTLTPKFEAVGDMYVLENANHRIELHRIPNEHNDGTLVAYLPKERILMQADFTLPVAGAQANAFVLNLANYVDSHNLDFDQYLAVHAAAVPQTKAMLMATIGK